MKKYIIVMAGILMVGCATNQPLLQMDDLLFEDINANYAKKSANGPPDDGKKGPFPPG